MYRFKSGHRHQLTKTQLRFCQFFVVMKARLLIFDEGCPSYEKKLLFHQLIIISMVFPCYDGVYIGDKYLVTTTYAEDGIFF